MSKKFEVWYKSNCEEIEKSDFSKKLKSQLKAMCKEAYMAGYEDASKENISEEK